jgi:hypothetical protein
MAHKQLSKDEVRSILDDVHGLLQRKGVQQPVHLRFAAAEAGLCWRWDPNAGGWTQVPC